MKKDIQTYESTCFSVISAAGTARSCFLEAIENAKEGQEYQSLLDDGYNAYVEAAKAHAVALQLEAEDKLDNGLLLIHAETILSSAETIWNLAETIIDLINKTK